ncbi:MAG: hypothetical protein P4L96_16805 [Rhodoferax sp.]|nr:hypothetical protein [Rhodoferax sp.]
MKAILTATLVLLSPALVLAQASAPSDAAKPSNKPAAKHATKHVAKKKPVVSTNRQNLKSAAMNAAAGIEAADAALTPAELAIAQRVYVGSLPCELGATVTLTADPKSPGYFDVRGKNFNYHMFPVVTSTGAVRLEDHREGAVWLQLGNKSMLMNQKLGQRMADECKSPAQATVAENMKEHPGPSLLDAPVKAGAAPAASK